MPHYLGFIAAMLMLLLFLIAGTSHAAKQDEPCAADTSEHFILNRSSPDTGTTCRLDRMVVTARRIPRKEKPTVQPDALFSADEITRTAGAAGDLCRYLAMQPSVVSSLGEDFDNTLFVRGGRASEIIFVVDGIEFENINHFSQANGSGGPVGFINGDFVRRAAFHAGAPPVQYPSRLSSVVAIDMKNGSPVERHATLSGKLTGAMASLEGPCSGRGGSYVLAGRYIDFSLLRQLYDHRGIPRLGDAYLKGIWGNEAVGDFSCTGLFSFNDFSVSYPVVEAEDASAALHGNTRAERQRIVQGGAGITWQLARENMTHRADLSFSLRNSRNADSLFFFNDTFFTSRYSCNPVTEEDDDRSRMVLATTSTIHISNALSIRFGVRGNVQRYDLLTADARHYRGAYTYCTDCGPVTLERDDPPRRRRMQLDGNEAGGFGEIALAAGAFDVSLGMRADYYRLLRKTGVSPRLALSWNSDRIGLLSFDCGVQHQFPTEMPSLFFYFFSWFPGMSDDSATARTRSFLERTQLLRCFQTSVGYERKFTEWMELKSGAYFKWYDREYNFVSPKLQEVLFLTDGQQWDLRAQVGKRRAFGIEFLLSSPPRDGLTYSAGGSLFDVKNRWADGTWYDDWTNVRYTGSLSIGMRLLQRHSFSFTLQGHGGRPYCPEVAVEDCIGRKLSTYTPGSYYTQRLERYISTHVRYGFGTTLRRLSIETFVEAINLLNRQPVLEYRFDGESYQAIRPFGIVPIVGVKMGW